MRDAEAQLMQRYFRKTIANPEGALTHHGDCDFSSIKICTCGLLHDLLPLRPELMEKYAPFWEERAKYDEVRNILMGSTKPKPKRKKR
jgi:hypothetical protein